MYAVIETGGKQYRVEVGTELEVELLDVEPGNTITLDRVLLVADGDDASIGQPLVANAAVSAEVLRQARGDKVIAFKYRPKARRRVKRGHRQDLTVLRISDITLGAKSAAKTVKKASEEAKTERARLEEAAAQQAAADAELAAKLAARTKPAETEAKPKRSRAKAAEAPAEPRRPRRPSRRPRRPRRSRSGRARRPAEPMRLLQPTQRQSRSAPAPRRRTSSSMAHKKAGSSSKNGRDSVGQRLGVKAGDGQTVTAGSIIVRQRGMTFLAGPGTGLGGDYTVFATVDGTVKFEHATKSKKRIRVIAADAVASA